MKKFLAVTAILSLVFLPVTPAFAATYYWDTISSMVWETAANWSDADSGGAHGVPADGDSVVFNQSAVMNPTEVVQLGGNKVIARMIIGNTGTTLIDSNLQGTTRTLSIDTGGITVNSGAGAVNIGYNHPTDPSKDQPLNIILTAVQAWTNNSSNILTIVNNIANGANLLIVTGSGDTTLNGVLGGGAGGLTLAGTGTLTLSGANTYTGLTSITGGTLSINTVNATSTGVQALGENAALSLSGGGTLAYTGIAGTLAKNITLGAGGGTISSSGSGLLTLTGGVNNAGNNLTIDGANATTVSGTKITGAGNLIKNGSGTLNLNVLSDYTGATTINVGTVKVGVDGALGAAAGGVSVTATNGALDLNGTTYTVGSALSIIGTGVGATGALTNSGAAASYAGVVTVGGAGASIGGSGDISLGAGLGADATALTKVGNGTLALNALSTRTGTLEVAGGTLTVGANGAMGTLATGVTVDSGATLDLNGVNYATASALGISGTGVGGTTGALTNSGAAAVYNGAVTLGADSSIGGSGDVTLGNSVNGAHVLTKIGADKLTLTSDTNGSTTTTITAGTLQIGNGGAGGALGSGLVSNSGNLTINQNDAFTIGAANAISGTGSFTQAGNGTTTLSGTNTYTGATSVTAGILQIGSGGTTGSLSSSSTITNSGTLLFDRSNTVTQGIAFATGITGSGALTQAGTGTLILNSANTYTGATAINAGTLQVSNAGALGTGGTAHVTNGATLDIGTTALTVGGNYVQTGVMKLAANSVVDYGSITAGGLGNVAGTIDVTIGGYIPNGGTLSVLTSTGALTYNTGTTINVLGDTKYTLTGAKSGNVLVLTASRAANGFASDAGSNSNAAAAGNVLDNISGATGDMLTVLNTLDGESAGAVGTALGTMTPDVSSGTAEASRATTANALTMISNRLGGARDSGAGAGISSGDMTNGVGVWMQGLGSNMKQDERKGIQGYSANLFGTTIGADKVIDDHFRAGLAGGYGWARVNSKQPGSPSDDINSFQGTVYGSYDSLNLNKARQGGKKSYEAVRSQVENSWYVDGMVNFTQNNYDSRREIWLTPSAKRVAKADHYGQQYSTNFETGYKFVFKETKALEVTPFASLGYNYLYMNSYKEKGRGFPESFCPRGRLPSAGARAWDQAGVSDCRQEGRDVYSFGESGVAL